MKKHLTTGRIVCYLLFLTLVCTLLFGATYSRYGSQVTGAGIADIAAVSLNSTVDLSPKLSGMVPGETRNIMIQVSNQKESGAISEVTQGYTITIDTTGNLPLTYTLDTTDTPNIDHALTPSEDSLVWTGGVLPHTQKTTHTYTLGVTWPKAQNDPRYANNVDAVRFVVDSQQKID